MVKSAATWANTGANPGGVYEVDDPEDHQVLGQSLLHDQPHAGPSIAAVGARGLAVGSLRQEADDTAGWWIPDLEEAMAAQ